MKKRIKTSKKDNRHTNKPYTKEMWEKYEYEYFRFKCEELARKYGVSIRTIYRWNSEMKERWTLKNQAWINSCKTIKDILKDK